MTNHTTSILPPIPTSIFTVMSQLAIDNDAVNLGQGFPDYAMSRELVELVNQAMQSGLNQYTHSNGLPALRQQISNKVFNCYNAIVNPDTEITITPGGTYAIYTALTSVLCPGDEVIVFEPAYDSYLPNIEINGATPVLIPLSYPDYSIPWDVVSASITSRTKMIMINSPHNPTGSVLRQEDMVALQKIVQDTNIIILSDEVYEHLIFDGISHQSVLRYPDLLQRSFVCFSFGKTYHCTGWKLGYCIAGASLMKEFRKVHQFNCFSCFSPAQPALATYLSNTDAYNGLGSFMQQKRDYFNQLMTATAFKPLPSYGSYFQCYSYAGISEEPDYDFAISLVKEHKVAVIPLSAFYKHGKDDKVVRFCFAKKEETVKRAVDRLIAVK